MKLHFVESMDEVLKIALEREIVALPMPARFPAWSRSPTSRKSWSRTSEADRLPHWRA